MCLEILTQGRSPLLSVKISLFDVFKQLLTLHKLTPTSDATSMYFWYYSQFFILALKISQAKILNIYFSTIKLYILGKTTSKYCSPIYVVHVHATVFFSKVHLASHNIANGIKPGSNAGKVDKHAVDCSKVVCWCVK